MKTYYKMMNNQDAIRLREYADQVLKVAADRHGMDPRSSTIGKKTRKAVSSRMDACRILKSTITINRKTGELKISPDYPISENVMLKEGLSTPVLAHLLYLSTYTSVVLMIQRLKKKYPEPFNMSFTEYCNNLCR